MKNYTEFCNEQAKIIFDIINNHENLLKWQKTWSVKNSLSLLTFPLQLDHSLVEVNHYAASFANKEGGK